MWLILLFFLLFLFIFSYFALYLFPNSQTDFDSDFTICRSLLTVITKQLYPYAFVFILHATCGLYCIMLHSSCCCANHFTACFSQSALIKSMSSAEQIKYNNCIPLLSLLYYIHISHDMREHCFHVAAHTVSLITCNLWYILDCVRPVGQFVDMAWYPAPIWCCKTMLLNQRKAEITNCCRKHISL